MRQLDFTALRPGSSTPDLPGGTARRSWSSGLRFIAIIAVSIVCLLIVAAWSFMALGRADVFSVIPELLHGAVSFTFVAVVLIGGIETLYYASVRRKQRLAKIAAFAAANQLTFRQDIAPDGLSGMIFDEGHDRTIAEVLAFPDGIEIGNYRYVTGSGKNRRTHSFGYVRIALNKTLPNMVLDAKSSNFMGITNLPDVFHPSQKLQLEGDFNSYFDLYVPRQYERDALYVFTPDVMQVLIDSGRQYDMEVVGSELYVYQSVSVDLASEKRLGELLRAVDAITAELRSQTSRYRDERLRSSAVQGVAEQGRRLKKGVNWIIVSIVLGVIAMNMVMMFAPDEFSVALSIAIGFLFWGVVIFAFVSRLRGRA